MAVDQALIIEARKKEATDLLNIGVREFKLHVDMMSERERNKIRLHVNRWMRNNGWRGSVHYDRSADELQVQLLTRRETE